MPSEQQLSDVLKEFARTMVTDFPIQGILDHLVLRIVEILPITAAGVTLIVPGSHPRYLSASSAAALRFEQLQTELSDGPCLAAYTTGDAVCRLPPRRDHLVATRKGPPRGPRGRSGGHDQCRREPRQWGGPAGAARRRWSGRRGQVLEVMTPRFRAV
jgi:hypothetical protein